MNLVVLDPSSGYTSISPDLFGYLLTDSQIRIVVDTHQDEKPNKKKKKHRGYAFVVYEREKDMRGNEMTTPYPFKPPLPDPDVWNLCTDMALKLPISSLLSSSARIKGIFKYGQPD